MQAFRDDVNRRKLAAVRRSKGQRGSHRGSKFTWTPQKEAEAIDALYADIYASNSIRAMKSAVKKYEETCETGVPCQAWPLSVRSMAKYLARIKDDRLKGARSYVSHVKSWNALMGHDLLQFQEAVIRKLIRSALRGIGPKVRKDPFTIELRGQVAHAVTAMPAARQKFAKRVLDESALAFFFFLRHAELAAVKAEHVALEATTKSVTLYIPSSKTDQEAKGARRTYHCCCSDAGLKAANCALAGSELCPYCSATRLCEARTEPGELLCDSRYDYRLKTVFEWCGIETTRKVGNRVTNRFGTHCNRRAAAKACSAVKELQEVIAFLGRWAVGSAAVQDYIEGAYVAADTVGLKFPYPAKVRAAAKADAKASKAKSAAQSAKKDGGLVVAKAGGAKRGGSRGTAALRKPPAQGKALPMKAMKAETVMKAMKKAGGNKGK